MNTAPGVPWTPINGAAAPPDPAAQSAPAASARPPPAQAQPGHREQRTAPPGEQTPPAAPWPRARQAARDGHASSPGAARSPLPRPEPQLWPRLPVRGHAGDVGTAAKTTAPGASPPCLCSRPTMARPSPVTPIPPNARGAAPAHPHASRPALVSQHHTGPGPSRPVSARPTRRHRTCSCRTTSGEASSKLAMGSARTPYISPHHTSPAISRAVNRTLPASIRPTPGVAGFCRAKLRFRESLLLPRQHNRLTCYENSAHLNASLFV